MECGLVNFINIFTESKFFEQNPNYKPTGVWLAFEGKGLSEQGGNTQVKGQKKAICNNAFSLSKNGI